MRVLALLAIVLLPLPLGASFISDLAWSPIQVKSSEGETAIAKLEHQGIDCISESNAVVEVSAFEGLEMVPLSGLDQRLADSDPRWDPWLRAVAGLLHPSAGVTTIFVSPADRGKAFSAIGGQALPGQRKATGPRLVTAWLLLLGALGGAVILGLLWASFRTQFWRRETIVATSIVGVAALSALVLLAAPRAEHRLASANPIWSWAQHRWFQESWPYGARWTDWRWNTPWKYTGYRRVDGRIVAVDIALRTPDEAWLDDSWKSLPPHHAARVLGFRHP